jgi:hypothetical protein
VKNSRQKWGEKCCEDDTTSHWHLHLQLNLSCVDLMIYLLSLEFK